ncbi:ROK family protein [Paenactinomyces guangxiensis]|uniref:ROK family transcriptional regulator n=1 Tax=Paenactinomyces guangxiensis TaxID=1490290 RepID=A0A7W1WUG8_9BACL|nr:ROK family transcriptional regulator [Paenactinomyces guangxiensis]MBA4496259.1 ROK family transcriptional regulator [Paenactinomyces guangxiensis]MBH8593359.1 ROK family transcriptional regulator [Paenactinomyces guangxiensis]
MLKGTGLLRQQNEKRALSFLRIHRTTFRLEIAEALGLSKNTVSLIVDKFMREGMIKEIGIEEQGGVGRPRVQLSLVPEAYKSIGILVQDTQGQYVVTDYCANVLEKGTIFLNSQNVNECLMQLIKLCKSLLNKHPEVLGIGVGIPALVDPDQGFVYDSSHLGWKKIAVKEILDQHLPVQARILNSVNAAALGQLQVIPEEDSSSVFYIRIDEGVGGALIIRNEIYTGSSWTAGEIGHLSVKNDGPICSCGQRGCLESLISIPAIKERIAQNDQAIQFANWPHINENDHDPAMEEIFRESGKYLGIAAAQMINLFNPKYIIIDSPFSRAEAFTSSVSKTAGERALKVPFEQTSIIHIQTHFSSAKGAALAVILHFESDLRG